MPILLFLLPVLKRFWLPITIGLVLLGGIWYTYNTGKKACEAKINQAIIKEQLESQQRIEKILARGGLLRDKIRLPMKDKTMSCILSNNPFKKECK